LIRPTIHAWLTNDFIIVNGTRHALAITPDMPLL
jgi:hypothetical protein